MAPAADPQPDIVDFAALAAAFLAAQLAGDRREAMRIVIEDGVDRGAPVIDLQARVIRVAQHEIGRLWQHNRVSIAQEYLATGICQLVMARLFELVAPVPRNGMKITVACVEGERHDLPARLVADYLEHDGFVVRYLGTTLSTSDLLRSLGEDRPALLALSITMVFNTPALVDAVRRVRAETHGALPIIVGGYAIQNRPALALELGVETAGDTPDALVATVRRLSGLS